MARIPLIKQSAVASGFNISIDDVTANEADATVVFSITLSRISDSLITVTYATANGTALDGTDYTARTALINFQPGQTNKTATISLLNDSAQDGLKEFTVNLSAPTGGSTIVKGTGTATIVDDEVVGGALFDQVVYQTAAGYTRTNALIDMTGTPLERIDNFNYPKLAREESTGNNPGNNPVAGQAHRLRKYDFVLTQLGGNTELRTAQNHTDGIIGGKYGPPVEGQWPASPAAQGHNTNGYYSHYMHYKGFGPIHQGGNPGVNNAFDCFPGFLLVSIPLTTTNAPGALTNGSDTKRYTVSGGSIASQIPNLKSPRGILILTPTAADWAGEANSATPYLHAELLKVKNTGSNWIDVQQAKTNAGNLFKSMGGGGSLHHGIGSKIYLVGKGQASVQHLNFRWNPSQLWCPRDGANKTYQDWYVDWMNQYWNINSSGSALSGLSKPFASGDVMDSYLAVNDKFSIRGNGTADNGYVNGQNMHDKGMAEIITKLLAQPNYSDGVYTHGGVHEHKNTACTAMQTESMDDGFDQQNIDENTKYYNSYAILDRALKGRHCNCKHHFGSTILDKTAHKFMLEGGSRASASNDRGLFEYSAGAIYSCSTSIRDVEEHNDPVPDWFHIIANPNNLQGYQIGDTFPNTDANQNIKIANGGWLGPPASDIIKVSGVGLMSNTADRLLNQRYDNGSINNNGTWTKTGSDQGGVTFGYSAAGGEGTGAIVFDGMKGSGSYGALAARTGNLFNEASHKGKDWAVYLKYMSNSYGHFNLQVGQSNKYDVKIYPEPGQVNHMLYTGKFSGTEDFNGTHDKKVTLELPRLPHWSQSSPDFHILETRVWSGNNLRDFALLRYFKYGVAVINGTDRTLTIPLRGNFIAPRVSSGSEVSWLIPGNTYNTLVVPPNCGAMLPRAADNYDFNSVSYDPANNTTTLLVPQGQGASYGSYEDVNGITRSPIITQNVAA